MELPQRGRLPLGLGLAEQGGGPGPRRGGGPVDVAAPTVQILLEPLAPSRDPKRRLRRELDPGPVEGHLGRVLQGEIRDRAQDHAPHDQLLKPPPAGVSLVAPTCARSERAPRSPRVRNGFGLRACSRLRATGCVARRRPRRSRPRAAARRRSRPRCRARGESQRPARPPDWRWRRRPCRPRGPT